MGFLVALPAWAVLLVVRKRVSLKGGGGGKGAGGGGGKGKDVISVITMSLAFIVGCGLAYTFVGRWIATGISWLGGWLGNGWQTGLPIALTLLAVLTAVADIAFDRKADLGAQRAAMLAPTLLFLVVGGRLGATGGGAVAATTAQMAAFIHQLGGH